MSFYFKIVKYLILLLIVFAPFFGNAEEQLAPLPSVSENYLDDKILALGVGVGGTGSPGLFSLKINADYIFDGLFSLGPYLQGAFDGSTTFIGTTLDGRFRFSIPSFREEFKMALFAGLGLLYRSNSGIRFSDLTGHVGLGGEFFVNRNVSVGVEGSTSFTSASGEKFFASFFAGANYYL